MTQKRRELMFKVMADCAPIGFYLHHFDQFHRCDDMLTWLISNRLTGKEFLEWTKYHFSGSMLDTSRYILSKLEKLGRGERRRVILGRDMH